MTLPLRRDFTNRTELADYLAAVFPDAAARDANLSPFIGGRKAAEERLKQITPRRYASTRNYLNGSVSRLSPYLRYGVLSLAEVRDLALQQVSRADDASKFVNELGWRDYWQRVYAALGDGVWQDLESYKTGYAPHSYSATIPEDVEHGTTGMVCMDSFSHDLRTNGWLHNHVRMWLAAYLVHWRRTRWQAGAHWFLQHLLDGDPASNNLSWQWVASTFSHKPYFFNRENLQRYTDGVYCRECPLADGGCPLDASYSELEARLFPRMRASDGPPGPTPKISGVEAEHKPAGDGPAIVWVNGDTLSPYGPALHAHPGAPAIFVFDTALIAEWQLSLKRLLFIYECLLELPVTIVQGDVASEVVAFAKEHGAQRIVTTNSPSPRFAAITAQVERALPVEVLDQPPYVAPKRRLDLSRFSRYWRSVEAHAMQPTSLQKL